MIANRNQVRYHLLANLKSRHTNTQPTLNTYSPSGKQSVYYRLSYRDGTRMKHIHVPGGNIGCQLVQYRGKKIQGMIDRGVTLSKIITLINSYKGKNNHKI